MQRGPAVLTLLSSLLLLNAGCEAFKAPPTAASKSRPTPVVPGPVDADALEEFTSTESGLKYRIRRKSDGKKPNPKSSVTAHYRGWLDDKEIFDSTYGTGGAPSHFAMNAVVPGWTEGLQLIGQGGMIELEIPSKLGYGAHGQPPTIPPNATLHFLVELIHVGDDAEPPHQHDAHTPHDGHKEATAAPEDAPIPEGFTTTTSGLSYRIVKESKGRKPTPTDKVKVHYRGKLSNGKVFDESYKRGVPAEFPLNGVIAGWTEGLQLVGVGGTIELIIPGKLGYPNGQPPTIPPNATLHFTVELLEIK